MPPVRSGPDARRRRLLILRALAALAALAVLAVVVASAAGRGASAPAQPAGAPVADAGQGQPCSRDRPPDPNRPLVRLVFRVAADHRSVVGTEHVVFRPDRPVHELVFRLWPNGPEGGRSRAWLTVQRAGTGGQAGPTSFQVTSAGGRPGTQGTLLTLPLPAPAAAGSVVSADLDFVVHLPPPGWDRMGSDGRTAWWASAHPLLAWQRGVGWTWDAASPLPGETATSEAADTDVTVVAPAADTVLTGGAADPPQPAPGGQQAWHFHAPTVRDVAVAVGPFQLATAELAGSAGPPTQVSVAVAPGAGSRAADVLAEVRRALPLLTARFGPVPFPALRLAGVPGLAQSGIEYPGMILLLGPRPPLSVVTHELAHQWFYGLVGNNQARDPWLDEAFATYAETVLTGPPAAVTPGPLAPADVGGSMRSFGTDFLRYTEAVYNDGADALLAARDLAGPAAFDQAVRCYLTDLAWQVATPADLAAHLGQLPAALHTLRRWGAL